MPSPACKVVVGKASVNATKRMRIFFIGRRRYKGRGGLSVEGKKGGRVKEYKGVDVLNKYASVQCASSLAD